MAIDNITITIGSKTKVQPYEPHSELGLVRLYVSEDAGASQSITLWIERSEVARLMVAIAEAAAMLGPAKKPEPLVEARPELGELVSEAYPF